MNFLYNLSLFFVFLLFLFSFGKCCLPNSFGPYHVCLDGTVLFQELDNVKHCFDTKNHSETELVCRSLNYEKLVFGDVLIRRMPQFPLFYHVALIYNQTHLVHNTLKIIQLDTINFFRQDREESEIFLGTNLMYSVIADKMPNFKFDPPAIRSRIHADLGSTHWSLINNNCENAVLKWITGKQFASVQVQWGLDILKTLLFQKLHSPMRKFVPVDNELVKYG